jgi:hypothetical protein
MPLAKYERFIICADTHGDMIDPSASAAFFEFMSFWKPKHRIHLGDIFDLRWLREKASAEEQLGINLQADLDAGADFLKRMKPTQILLGNHDHRAIRAMRSPNEGKAKLAAACWAEMEDSMCGVKPAPYNKRTGAVPFGDRILIHGFASGINACRKQTLIFGPIISGHNHNIERITTERHDRAEGMCIGTLALLDMDFNETQLTTLRQEHGFAYGCRFESGKTVVWQAQSCEGTWLFPSEMREVKRA